MGGNVNEREKGIDLYSKLLASMSGRLSGGGNE